jgi:16S rRNA (guanine966-N2)-methyltransferase
MRIVAGTLRGRTLVAPSGASTRPTADRTRQALFNVLEHAPWSRALKDMRVLDLFAGSGALGLEALSRGAQSSLFVDKDAGSRAAIEANLQRLDLVARARVERWDAERLPARSAAQGDRFDLVFLDPPYGAHLATPALAALAKGEWLTAAAIVVVEIGADDQPPGAPGFDLLADRNWGAARVRFLTLAGSV